jgi:hypothetical protein
VGAYSNSSYSAGENPDAERTSPRGQAIYEAAASFYGFRPPTMPVRVDVDVELAASGPILGENSLVVNRDDFLALRIHLDNRSRASW